MAKKIVIGVGGTGLEVLRCLRKRIIQDYPESGFAQFPRLGFLYIDTDPGAVEISEDNKKRWEVMGRSIELTPAEHIIIQAPAIGRILENLPSYPQVRDWLPIHQLKGMDTAAKDTPGAQQIRALGRMIFTLESDRVRQRVASLIDSLPDDPLDGTTEVHIACSLSGGTGGGMFLDLAYSLRRWTNDRALTTGYLVLPDLNQEASRGRRYVANAYGALMDLNYFSQRARTVNGREVPVAFTLPAEHAAVTDKNPFDFCYLLSTRNQSGVALSLNTVPDMISHRLYLTLDNAIVSDVAAMMNNGAMQRGRFPTDPVNGNVLSQAFSTFGLSTIQYPTEQIVEIVSHRLAQALVASWADPSPVDNVNERVVQRMPELLMIDDVFLGNRDIFQGANDFGSIANDVERQLNDALTKLPNSNRAPELNRIYANFLDEFRGGLRHFYRSREDNLDGAVQLLTRKVRAFAVDSIMDADLGLPFAQAALDEIVRLLGNKQQELSTRREQLGPRVKNSRSGVSAAIAKVTEAEGALIFPERKLKEAMTAAKEKFSFNLIAQVEERALEYSVGFVSKLTQALAALRTELGEWASSMVVVRNLLAREIGRRAESLEAMQKNSNQFNGAILFKTERVDQIYNVLNTREAMQFMRDQLSRKADVMKLGQRPEETVEALFAMASDWLTRVSSVRVAHKNVADQLLEDYPGADNAERRQLIDATYRRSAAFLEFDQGEMEIYKGQVGHAYEFDRTTATERAGMMDHEQNRFPSVAQVRADISKATGLPPDGVRIISDTHQIIFMSERTAFPLRVIRDVRTLRDAYRGHAAQKGSLPLLLQKDYNPPIGDLMLVSQIEVDRLHRAEADFLTGWTRGWIRSEHNNTENRQEVRYRFFEAGADQYAVVGNDREASLAYFTSEDPDSAPLRRRLAEAVEGYADSLDTHVKRAEFAGALSGVLDAMKAEIPYGEESNLYKRYNRIRQFVMTAYKLPVTAAAPGVGPTTGKGAGTSTGSLTQLSGTDADFAKYVGLLVTQFKGQLGEKSRAAIKSRQQVLRISDTRADEIIAAALAPYAVAPNPVDQYKETLELLLAGSGVLSEDAQIQLVDLQAEYDIDADLARRLEQEVRASLGKSGRIQ